MKRYEIRDAEFGEDRGNDPAMMGMNYFRGKERELLFYLGAKNVKISFSPGLVQLAKPAAFAERVRSKDWKIKI
jgi:hypothetical protein